MREGTAPPNPLGNVEKVKMDPARGSKDLLEPAGPIDPTVSFIALRDLQGAPNGLYSAYSLHYVGGVRGRSISADYFGMFCEALKAMQPTPENAPPFVAIMANDSSGDINNVDFRNNSTRRPALEQMGHPRRGAEGAWRAGQSHLARRRVARGALP